jgi:glyoxylase-like metal-dependent hydrolase (beta-lactamase superfamily II)
VTELDLRALGIWRIPIPLPGTHPRETVNAWAIEDVDGGVALLDCGFDTPESVAALADGLDEGGTSFQSVRRIILSHSHAEHSGGVRRVLELAPNDVAVHASRSQAVRLRHVCRRAYPLRDRERLRFRRFAVSALRMPGHTAGLTCLFAEYEGIFFSSDHLLNGTVPVVTCAPANADLREAYRASLLRLGALDVRVVLPGRGVPFAGHRRVVGEILTTLAHERWGATPATRRESVGRGAGVAEGT